MVDVFRKEEFELIAFTETKLIQNGEVSWCRVNGVQEIERARGGVAVLMNVWHSAMILLAIEPYGEVQVFKD